MSALARGLIVLVAQVLLAGSVGAKFLLDRANYPMVWAESAPYDPDLPIRGRYVSILVLVDGERAVDGKSSAYGPGMFMARLEVKDNRLVAVEDPEGRHFVSERRCGEKTCWQLAEPVAYFIPEHVQDPSRRPPGEKLWVEVTVPPEGPPRPVRLGTRREGDPSVTPLDLD